MTHRSWKTTAALFLAALATVWWNAGQARSAEPMADAQPTLSNPATLLSAGPMAQPADGQVSPATHSATVFHEDYESIHELGDVDCTTGCKGPKCVVNAGVIFLKREDTHGVPLLESPAGRRFLTSNSFDFDHEDAWFVAAQTYLTDGFGVGARFFIVDQYSEHARRVIDGPGQIDTRPNTPLGGAQLTDWQYQVQFQSAEFNLWHRPAQWLQLLAGFRWVQYEEDLDVGFYTVPAGPIITNTPFQNSVDNKMYGFQIGAQGTLWQYGPFGVDFIAKAGIYNNNAELVQKVRDPGGAFGPPRDPYTTAQKKRDITSFLGEVALLARYQVTKNIAIRAGYHLIWLDGVATAVEQVPQVGNVFAAGNAGRQIPTNIDDSTVFFRGARIDLVFTY